MVWVGGVPLEETVHFYRAASAFAYPSFNETFGLPILEAMAADARSSPRTEAPCPRPQEAPRCWPIPSDPESIADALIEACGAEGAAAPAAGLARAAEFTWARTAERTLDVYREVHAVQGVVRA